MDKLPLTVDALAQSGLGKLIKYVVEHPPTTGESLFLFSSLLLVLSFSRICGRGSRACCFPLVATQQLQRVLVASTASNLDGNTSWLYCDAEMVAHYSTLLPIIFFLRNLSNSLHHNRETKPKRSEKKREQKMQCQCPVHKKIPEKGVALG